MNWLTKSARSQDGDALRTLDKAALAYLAIALDKMLNYNSQR